MPKITCCVLHIACSLDVTEHATRNTACNAASSESYLLRSALIHFTSGFQRNLPGDESQKVSKALQHILSKWSCFHILLSTIVKVKRRCV